MLDLLIDPHAWAALITLTALEIVLGIDKRWKPEALGVAAFLQDPATLAIAGAASRELRPSLPILLATGYAELPEGAQLDLPRLAKPYHQDQLRDRLDQLLG